MDAKRETRDVRPAAVIGLAAALIVALLASLLAASWLFKSLRSHAKGAAGPSSPFERAGATPSTAAPPLQPGEQLDLLRAHEKDALETYGWVNRPAGIIRIPIERAMARMVEQASRSGSGQAHPGKESK